jgi:hypothetical protein
MKSCGSALAFITLLTLYAALPANAQRAPAFAGRPVGQVLRELQTPTFRIIFSSDLVPATLLVKTEPTASRPQQIALQILLPHGLTLVPGPRGRLLVVALTRESPPAPQPVTADVPRDKSAATSVELPDNIRIEERVEVSDRLEDQRTKPAVYTLEPGTIQEQAGAFEDVRRALQLLPGVAGTNDRDGKMSVRGAGPEHNILVVDGVQIHNPHRLGEFTSSFLNPATTASVALDASGLDARHGGRLSSVTIIETRDGRRDRRLGLSGSLGLTSGDVLLEGRLPNTATGSWWATARGTYYSALMERFGDAVPGFADTQVKLSVRPTRTTRLTAFGLVGRETAREPAQSSDAGLPDSGASPGGNGAPELRTDGDQSLGPGSRYKGLNRLAITSLWWTPGPRFATTTTLSAYAHSANDFDGSLLRAGVPAFDRKVRVSDFAVRQRAVYTPSAGHLLDAGVDAHRVRSSWEMDNVKWLDLFRGIGPTTQGELIDYSAGAIAADLTRTQAGAWLQYRVPLGSAWTAEPGVRTEWNSFTREASWEPRLRLSARVGRTTVSGGVAVQAQTPSHESLQSFDYLHLTSADGARLRNERARQIVAGIDQTFAGGFTLRVEAYHRWFDRLLIQRLETDAERATRLAAYVIPPDLPSESAVLEHRPTIEAESTGRGDAAGVEMLLKREGRRVTGSLAYTFSKATRDMYGRTIAFDFDRPHAVVALTAVQISKRIRVAATWQRASGFPATAIRDDVRFTRRISRDGTVDPFFRTSRLPDGSLSVSPDPGMRRLSLRNTERLNGYARADVRATYSAGRWELYGEILNVFNRWNHVQRIQYSSFGTNLGELVTENNAYAQFLRLPSFGVRVTF